MPYNDIAARPDTSANVSGQEPTDTFSAGWLEGQFERERAIRAQLDPMLVRAVAGDAGVMLLAAVDQSSGEDRTSAD